MSVNRQLICGWLTATLFFLPVAAYATERYASIIIDDLGDNLADSKTVAALPAPITLAIMPGTPYSKTTAKLARRNGKEILLHMPMQSVRHHEMSSGTLHLHMSREQFKHRLKQSLSSIPGVIGLNNHMGSLITRHPGHMGWLMQTLSEHSPMLFVDSRTTKKSVALQIAEEHNIPSVQRDVFLDPTPDAATINQQFDRFISLARNKGAALAIAHPYPNTLKLIRKRLPELKRHGIKLVGISEYVNKKRKQHVSCTGPACTGL